MQVENKHYGITIQQLLFDLELTQEEGLGMRLLSCISNLVVFGGFVHVMYTSWSWLCMAWGRG